MKYPQLVSARAVNAISDWLVTRLEQLGIDAPLVYSRLLLSLLHTPLQINALDLAEISDINVGSSCDDGDFYVIFLMNFFLFTIRSVILDEKIIADSHRLTRKLLNVLLLSKV